MRTILTILISLMLLSGVGTVCAKADTIETLPVNDQAQAGADAEADAVTDADFYFIPGASASTGVQESIFTIRFICYIRKSISDAATQVYVQLINTTNPKIKTTIRLRDEEDDFYVYSVIVFVPPASFREEVQLQLVVLYQGTTYSTKSLARSLYSLWKSAKTANNLAAMNDDARACVDMLLRGEQNFLVQKVQALTFISVIANENFINDLQAEDLNKIIFRLDPTGIQPLNAALVTIKDNLGNEIFTAEISVENYEDAEDWILYIKRDSVLNETISTSIDATILGDHYYFWINDLSNLGLSSEKTYTVTGIGALGLSLVPLTDTYTEQLKSQNRALSEQIDTLQNEINGLERQIYEINNQINEKNAKIAELQAEIERLNAVIEITAENNKSVLENLDKDKKELLVLISSLEAERSDLEAKNRKLEKEKEELIKQLSVYTNSNNNNSELRGCTSNIEGSMEIGAVLMICGFALILMQITKRARK